jgi:hypothetical protein
VPVVFVAALDPIETGVVTSLARPGGNVTGLTAVFADLTGKRLEFLKEMLPTLTRVALLSRPANPGHVQYNHASGPADADHADAGLAGEMTAAYRRRPGSATLR